MKVSQLANRYAKSIFEVAAETKTHEKTLAELRALAETLNKEPEVLEFLGSPVVKSEERERVLEAALKNGGASEQIHQLLLLLARNNRFAAFPEIVEAYQGLVDDENGVVRGIVRSAANLGPAERQTILDTVEKVVKKKVIMTYKIDPAVIGGLVAQVGSYTFDDSLDSHLTRMNEELKRA